MNELALFHGAGFGLLGGRLLGWRTVCGVEIDPYRRRVVEQRQREGLLHHFPIWDDACTFDGRPWRGCVDVVSAGVPCPKWSDARRGRGNPPDLLGEALRVYLECGARFLLLENVRGFRREAARIAAALGHCHLAGPLVLDAAALGAPHARKRCWILADANRDGESARAEHGEVAELPSSAEAGAAAWWASGPAGLVRLDDGGADRVERLSAAGDGQLPAMVVAAWRLLVTA